MSTVAEGIETETQVAVVRELGCDKGQGYRFSKPLLPVDLVNLLRARPSPAGQSETTTHRPG
jgi:EAL domain-containing protein (putative c-di-GMP-specific phosphodiesterase class I)